MTKGPFYFEVRFAQMRQHPYRERRARLGLSQKRVAELAGISPQVVMRTEQGLYATPSAKLIEALLGSDPGEGRNALLDVLHREHSAYLKYIRGYFGEEIRVGCAHLVNNVAPKKLKWRFFAPSEIAFCKMIAVQQSVVQRWDFNGAMPPLLEEAFSDAGVDNGTIRRINQALR